LPSRKRGSKLGAGAPGGTGAEVTRISKPERLLNLVAFLLSSRRAVPFSRIRGRVAGYDDPATPEALEKRFDRDKAELRALGVPIVYEASDEHGEEGYRIPREQYFLPDVRLTMEEAAALAVVQRYAFSESGDPLAGYLQSALRKVLVDSPLTGAAAASVTEQHHLGVRTSDGAAELGPNLEALTDGVIRRQPVRFRYYSVERDDVEEREVEPYGIGWHGKHWYMVGYDRRREAVRQFRVDRIRGRAKVRSSKPFQVPEDFDVSAHVGKPATSFGEGESRRVTLELLPEVAFMFRESARPDWELAEGRDGRLLVTIDATDTAAALRLVANQREHARIVAPADVVADARENFRAILARHEGAPSEIPGRRAGRGRR
jgi:proteasome accessory factor B